MNSRSSWLSTLCILLLVCIAVLAWIPVAQSLAEPTADQVSEQVIDLTLICRRNLSLGWLDSLGVSSGPSALFSPLASALAFKYLVCCLANTFAFNPLVVYLIAGQLLAWLLAYFSLRWLGFGREVSHLSGFLMVTAPCSFSRVGHLGLAFMIPVIPTLAACLRLHRFLWEPGCSFRWFGCIATGAIACLLSFPFHEYYVVFAVLILFSICAYELLLSSSISLRLSALRRTTWIVSLFMTGYLAVLAILAIPKLFAVASSPVPADWAAPRFVIEQFRYGLLPLVLLIPSPAVPAVIQRLSSAGLQTGAEAYFWTTGSLLVPLALVAAVRRLLQKPYGGSDRRFLALLLLLTTSIGFLVMTMGGLGTLFAAYVTPVLRSLNRYGAFVYGAAVMYLMGELQHWLDSHVQAS